MATATKLTNLQQELLKIYSTNISDEELLKLKRILADFFAEDLADEVNKFCKEKNINENDIENWLNEKT